jgi:hypothetical protein
MQTLIQTIDSTGLYATVAQDYLYDNAGTDAREPISALRAKQDALTFNYYNSKITGINSSAIGGPGALSGLAYSASPNAYFIPIDKNLIYKSVEVDGVTYTGIGINTNGITTNSTGSTGQYSFVIGRNTCAEYGGFAGGIGSSADGEGSFAIGNTSYASNGGHAIGNNVSAGDQNILVIGKYNYQQSDAYLVIGNGTNNSEGKSDILVVDNTGLTVNSDINYRYNNSTSSLTSLTNTVNELNDTVQGYSTIIGTVEDNYQNWNTTYTDVNTSSTYWNGAYDTVYSNSSNWNSIATNGITGVSVDSNQLTVTNNTVNIELTGKVDKVTGKGLSTNDYETSAKTVVDNAALVIPNDAAANNQLVSNSTMQAAIANVGHFEIVSLGQNDEPSVQDPSTKIFYLTKPSNAATTDPYTEWIYTSSSPSNTAWNVIGSTEIDLNGYAKVPTAYTANHILTYDSTTQTLLDAGVTTADLEGSITAISINSSALPISQKSVNIPLATTTTDGILGSADKTKLDGIESGANVNVQADWSVTSTASDAYIANKPDIVIPLTSNAFSAPTNIVVVSAMPSSPDPTTIYLVKEAT